MALFGAGVRGREWRLSLPMHGLQLALFGACGMRTTEAPGHRVHGWLGSFGAAGTGTTEAQRGLRPQPKRNRQDAGKENRR